MALPMKISVEIDGDEHGLLTALAGSDAAIHGFARNSKKNFGDAGDESSRSFGSRFSSGLERSLLGAMRVLGNLTRGAGSALGGLARGAGGLASMAAMPTLITGLVFGAAQLAAALGPLVGLVNLLPALIAPAAMAISTLIVAFKGVGDALKNSGDPAAYAEALKKISPAAREVVRSLVEMKPLLHQIRMDVQEGFFSQFSRDIQALGTQYLPLLRSHLAFVSVALGRMVSSITGLLRAPAVFDQIREAMYNAGQAINNAQTALAHLIHGFITLTQVGSRFLPAMGTGFADLTARFDAFITRISRSGELEQWIQSGLDAFRLLSGILKDVWNVLHPIIQALNQAGGGAGFLGELLHQLAGFLNSKEGMEFLVTLFRTLGQVFGTLAGILVALLPSLGRILVALGPSFVAILQTLGSVLTALLPSAEKLIIALGPVLLAAVEALTPVLVDVATAIGTVVDWITPFLPQLEKLAPAVTVLATAIAGLLVPAFVAWTVAATAAAIANIAASWEILVILAAIGALGYGIYKLVKNWKTVWDKIKEVAKAVADWFVGVGHWFAQVWDDITAAFKTGLAWIEAFPGKVWGWLQKLPGMLGHLAHEAMSKFGYYIGYGLGFIVRKFIELPHQIWHFITQLWETARKLWVAGLHWIIDQTSKMPGRVVGFITDLWKSIKWLFTDGIKKALKVVGDWIADIGKFLKGLGPKAKDALKDAGTWLKDAGINMMKGLWEGAKSMFSSITTGIKDFAKNLWHGFMDGIQGKSPSRLFMRSGESIVQGLIKGIIDNTSSAHAAVKGLVPGGLYGSGGGAVYGAYGQTLGSGGQSGGGAIVITLHNRIILDGKELHAGMIEPAQRYKLRTGVTGLA